MKTRTYNVYTFAELSDKAKQRAKDQFAADMGFSWGDEYLASIKALAAHFDGKASNWSIDWFASSYSSMSFDMPDEMEPDEIAARLAKLGTFNPETLRGNGDCLLTGYCGDEDCIDGFRAAWHKGERDLKKLMDAAFDTWIKAAQSDCEAQFKDDTFQETAEANNWEYEEDGSLA